MLIFFVFILVLFPLLEYSLIFVPSNIGHPNIFGYCWVNSWSFQYILIIIWSIHICWVNSWTSKYIWIFGRSILRHPNIFGYSFGQFLGIQIYSDICLDKFCNICSSLHCTALHCTDDRGIQLQLKKTILDPLNFFLDPLNLPNFKISVWHL